MIIEPYGIVLTRPVRQALSERLPIDVSVAAMEFINGPLAANPHRVGKELDPPYDGWRSARVMREWRVLYVIDEPHNRVVVRSIRHRRDAYRA